MNAQTILAAKASVLLMIAVIIANLLIRFPAPWDKWLDWAGIFLLVSHAIEVLVFAPRVKNAEGPAAMHYLQLFIFGYFHAETLKEPASPES